MGKSSVSINGNENDEFFLTAENHTDQKEISMLSCLLFPWKFEMSKRRSISVYTFSQTTNFTLFQTESLQAIISNSMKMAESFPNG